MRKLSARCSLLLTHTCNHPCDTEGAQEGTASALIEHQQQALTVPIGYGYALQEEQWTRLGTSRHHFHLFTHTSETRKPHEMRENNNTKHFSCGPYHCFRRDRRTAVQQPTPEGANCRSTTVLDPSPRNRALNATDPSHHLTMVGFDFKSAVSPSPLLPLCKTKTWRQRKKRKANGTRRASQAVPHPSTDRALRRLTSEFGWDRVHSTQYGRWR